MSVIEKVGAATLSTRNLWSGYRETKQDWRHYILSHRGLRHDLAGNPNSQEAVADSVKWGYGVEVDIRESSGELVLQHDAGKSGESWVNCLEALSRADTPIAINVKEDGLIPLLGETINVLHSAVFFDMSWPETLQYVRAGLPVMLRTSEWEPLDLQVYSRLRIPVRLLVDGFDSDWWLTDANVNRACLSGDVMVISPEIHGRDPWAVWAWGRSQISAGRPVYFCTDAPDELFEELSR